jgi:hypothetical protein
VARHSRNTMRGHGVTAIRRHTESLCEPRDAKETALTLLPRGTSAMATGWHDGWIWQALF